MVHEAVKLSTEAWKNNSEASLAEPDRKDEEVVEVCGTVNVEVRAEILARKHFREDEEIREIDGFASIEVRSALEVSCRG